MPRFCRILYCAVCNKKLGTRLAHAPVQDISHVPDLRYCMTSKGNVVIACTRFMVWGDRLTPLDYY